ncbi:MAG: CPBP family intramembrane metalloprotease [Lysobacter sp.]|nr:CPBP family intramembrane metalloprotease [Lysobacter sp.]
MSNAAGEFLIPWKQDLKLALIWGVLAALSAVALIPYLLQTMPGAFDALRIPFPAFVAIQAMQAFVLLGLLTLLGLRMGHRVGLGSPVLHGWVNRRIAADWRTLKPLQAIAMGVIAAVVIISLSTVLDPLLPKPLQTIPDPGAGTSAFNGLLASFFGGISEELQLRLFVMTLLVWLFAMLAKRAPRPWVYWSAIVVAAVLFGIGHLPAAGKIWELSEIVVFRTIVLNAIGGLVFGWLYWRRGIEMAMLGHFSADIVLHVLAPLLSTPLM